MRYISSLGLVAGEAGASRRPVPLSLGMPKHSTALRGEAPSGCRRLGGRQWRGIMALSR